jgi:phospholipase C
VRPILLPAVRVAFAVVTACHADHATVQPDADQGDDTTFGMQRAACAFSAGAPPFTTFGGPIVTSQIPIDTFVIIVQENRSFDHYFSQLPQFGQPDVDVAPADVALLDSTGQPTTRFHQTDYCFADTAHLWNAMHADWNGGKNDGFVMVNDPGGARTLGYFDNTDLPFYYQLASTFAISDRYFSPTLTSTGPNRAYLYAGTSAGFTYATNSMQVPPYSQTIFAALQAAGVTFQVYSNSTAMPPFSDETALYPELGAPHPMSEYAAAAASNTLPNVSILYVAGDGYGEEHPPSNMQIGQQGVAAAFATLAASPQQWSRSAFILTYDEGGGLYDHVPPPPACTPDAIPPMLNPGDEPGGFDRYGFRVPLIVASPWSRPHYVSHVVQDHTSVLRLIELRFGLGALTARDANANALIDLFDFSAPSIPVAPAMPPATIDPAHACP